MNRFASPEELQAFAAGFGRDLAAGAVLALTGDLGAGKTHFVKGLAEGLGFAGTVTSPTFTLLHEYRGGRLAVFHADLYRLKNIGEATDAGIEEALYAGGIAAVEWADKFPELFPPGTHWITLGIDESGARSVEIRKEMATP